MDSAKGVRWQDHISVNRTVCHGKACFTGTRVLVPGILDNLAAGVSEKEILMSYPSLSPNSLRAALAHATDLAKERVVATPA